MDGSLASIFMEGSLPALPLSWATSWESTEDLQHRLVCVSMELESTREAAKTQGKLHQAKLCRLQEMLDTTRKERDEARQECLKLQEQIRHGCSSTSSPFLPTSPEDSPCSFIHSSISSAHLDTFSSSPDAPSDLQAWSFHGSSQQQQQQQSSDLASLIQIHHSSQDNQDLHSIFSLEPCKEDVPILPPLHDDPQPFSMDVLDQDLPLDNDQSFDLTDLQEQQAFHDAWDTHLPSTPALGRSLTRQSSSNSSSASVQQPLQSMAAASPEISAPVSNHIPVVCSPQAAMGVSSPQATMAVCSAQATMGIVVPKNDAFSSQISSPLVLPQRFADSCPRTALPQRQVHLPEPPESDPKVMLSSLPEKGKLLQAVMQAGPLLQTLLLAGPLPQWRHPPPALNTGDIPKVSMSPNTSLFPFGAPHLPAFVPLKNPATGYTINTLPTSGVSNTVYLRAGAAARPESPAVNNSSPNSCSRSRKLRKLSSAGLHEAQMMSRDASC